MPSRTSKRSANPFASIIRMVSAHRGLMGILFVALILRLVFSYHRPPTLEGDSAYYHYIAENLVTGHGYSRTPEADAPTRIRPPVYPFFMAFFYFLFGPNIKTIVTVQALAGTLTCLITYLLANRAFGKRAGLLAALFTALYPALIYYDNRILRESLTGLLLCWTALLALNRDSGGRFRLFVVGAVLAALTLCKPEMLVLVGVYILLAVNRQSLIRSSLIVMIPILLAWVPWTARNYYTFDSISPVTTGIGGAVWFGSRWAEIGGDDHTKEAHQALQMETREILNTSEVQTEKQFMDKAIQDIVKRPGWFLSMVGRKVVMFWKDANGVKKTLPAIHSKLAPIMNACYYLLLLLALVGVARGSGSRRHVKSILALILTYMMTYALLHVRNRYRVPLLPLVFVLSAGGFWVIYDQLKDCVKVNRGRLGAFPSLAVRGSADHKADSRAVE